ncbi:MAG: nicotinate phosphoribosyltransferase [Acidobacteria bacterium]|nr:nicotinate phosphoribosyltransferase [Acidobacteriota bacterium]
MGLSTDLYELTMAQAFLEAGIADRTATFDLSIRSLPHTRGYLVTAGLEQALAYLRDFRCWPEALDYLERSGHFKPEFIDFLGSLRFTGSVDAVPEGTVYFPPGPLLRITAPIIEAQIIETYLLTTITYQTMIASKAARVVDAADGRAVIDFSPRRDHGPQAGLLAARAAYVGGCIGTSNVLANERFGIPIYGTMAHSFVMFHRDEEEAFRKFAASYPGDPTLLIDTFDTIEGARIAARVAADLPEGRKLAAVRIDSGDLLTLSGAVREVLDAGGCHDTQVLASGDLDEYKIEGLLREGAALDGFGVGTQLGTSGDSPSLSSTYKLVACDDADGRETPVIKLSAAKISLPGRKQIWRDYDADGQPAGDTVALADEQRDGTPLLEPCMRDGALVASMPELGEIRERARAQRVGLPDEIRRLSEPAQYPVANSQKLDDLIAQLRHR